MHRVLLPHEGWVGRVPGGPGAEGPRLPGGPSTPGPAQRPLARGHGGPSGVQHPQAGAPPRGLAQDGQRAGLSGPPRR
eukprot:15454736-Alexandrium_andersonii.AAC.1